MTSQMTKQQLDPVLEEPQLVVVDDKLQITKACQISAKRNKSLNFAV